MKQLRLDRYIPSHWKSYIIRPVGFDTRDGVILGYVLWAADEQQARTTAEKRWGPIESVELDDPQP